MLKKIDRRINRWKFKRSIYKLKDTEFCIVSSTCVGSRIYQILNRQYNTRLSAYAYSLLASQS